MSKQIYYEIRAQGHLRMIALAGTLALNVAMALIFGYADVLGTAGRILSVVFSGIMCMVALILSVVITNDSFRRLFNAPAAYAIHLTPVPGWKLLGSRLLVSIVQDLLILIVSVVGVVMQSLILANTAVDFSGLREIFMLHPEVVSFIWRGVLVLALGILYLYVLTYFYQTFARTILNNVFARKFLSLIATIVIVYLLSLLDIAMFPLAESTFNYGAFLHLQFSPFSNGALIAWSAIMIVRIAALFVATSYMLQRRINL